MLWDFDGTLAARPGLWSGCVLEVLDEVEPGHGVPIERIRTGLRDGFPWHAPDRPHPELCDPEAWWEAVGEVLAAALRAEGIGAARARRLANAVRTRYVDGTCGWQVFDDAAPALAALAGGGWRNVIVSNHVPELPELVDQLGLGELIEAVLTSARTGYEKPHPEAFRVALRACGEPESVWMVGDNPVADVAGALAVGVPAILVHAPGGAADLRHVVARILE